MELEIIPEVVPECRWRGVKNPFGKYACTSPKLVAPQGVTGEFCIKKCYCQNHEGRARLSTPKPFSQKQPFLPCIFRGKATGSTIPCVTCGGTVHLKLYSCSVYGKCTLNKRTEGAACCDEGCTERLETASKPKPNTYRIKFMSGLGDAVNFACSLPIYMKRGYEIEIMPKSHEQSIFLAAGARIINSGGTRHRWPDGIAAPITEDQKPWTRNKNGRHLSRAPMPIVGTVEELWEEYAKVKLTLAPYIDDTDRKVVNELLRNMPRPWIATHTIGGSWGKKRDYPPNLTVDMWARLIDKTGGSVIVLDWDNKAPKIPNASVAYFNKYTPEQLWEVLSRVELMIGTDSGPLNFVRLTDTPAIGIWSAHYPSDFFLPRANTIHVVGHHHYARDKIEGRYWNTILSSTVGQPSPDFMVETALDVLFPVRNLVKPPKCC